MAQSTVSSRTLRLARTAATLAVAAAVAAACGGDGGTGVNTRVTEVAVSAPSPTLEVGATLQLSAQARNASGNVFSDKSFTWASSSSDVAAVSETGLVTGVTAGTVTITATEPESGTAGTVSLTVTPAAVSSITVSPATASVVAGGTQQFAVELRDARGNVLTGRTVTWSSANADVASVDATGLVTGVAPGGPVAITVTVEGQAATAQVTVVTQTAARVAVTPRFATVDVGGTAALNAQAYDASERVIASPGVGWSSGSTTVATVSATGTVSGVAVGQATISAQVNSAVDSVWVAVLAPNSLLSTAFAGGNVKPVVTPGQTFTVPVVLDLSRVSSTGDLGSVQFDLTYDANVLTYLSAQPGVSGAASFNVPTPGTFKFSFASTNAQGNSRLTLVNVTFRVAAGATVGTQRAFGLTYTADPMSTGFAAYARPVALGGRIRVVAP